jgi:pyruvate-ferredoxin/flavodoxin oxidoreductase
MDDILIRLVQQDIVNRRYLDPDHRPFVPDRGVYIEADGTGDKAVFYLVSRQRMLFCVEGRKSWRMLQSRAGIAGNDGMVHKALLAKVDSGEIPMANFRARSYAYFREEIAEAKAA